MNLSPGEEPPVLLQDEGVSHLRWGWEKISALSVNNLWNYLQFPTKKRTLNRTILSIFKAEAYISLTVGWLKGNGEFRQECEAKKSDEAHSSSMVEPPGAELSTLVLFIMFLYRNARTKWVLGSFSSCLALFWVTQVARKRTEIRVWLSHLISKQSCAPASWNYLVQLKLTTWCQEVAFFLIARNIYGALQQSGRN